MLEGMRRVWPLLLLLAVGCSKNGGEVSGSTTGGSKPDPARVVYDQLRSGFVQLGNTQETIGEALALTETGKTSSDQALRDASKDMHEFLDLAGSYLSDYTEPPANFEEFNAKFAEHDDARLKSIDAANDSLHEVGEAKGIVDDLFNDPVLEKEQIVIDLRDLINEIEKNLREAIETLGGKVEEA